MIQGRTNGALHHVAWLLMVLLQCRGPLHLLQKLFGKLMLCTCSAVRILQVVSFLLAIAVRFLQYVELWLQ